jgi:hypothetical protein
MTSRRLVGELLEQLGPFEWRQEMGDDAKSERVTADTGEVFSQQVGCWFRISGGSCAHEFDVVAFPVHLLAIRTLCHGSDKRIEIGQGESEARVGANREAQCNGGAANVDGTLRLPVVGGGLPVCAESAPVVLDRWAMYGPLVIVGRWLGVGWLHTARLLASPEAPLR